VTDGYTRLAAALADRYRLERELGQGGMATVYLAQDLRHDRRVAVKVLRPELAAVIGAERFLAEIKTTAALQHPHILPLFDSGQADTFLFYVMPFVEGESLRDRLNREKQLPIPDAVRVTSEVASALDYAHRHGVIHRDIKPENVLLHDGQALVADFGIALAVSQAGGHRMTETGLSLGTPGYMSPEQATGDRTLDARSDVYSLGCLLYEMLVGEPPHTGPTVQAVIAAVVTKDPERLRTRRATVPAQVEAAVHQALAKLPADRFASAEAFAKALTDPSFSVARTATDLPAAPAARVPTSRNTLILAGVAALMAVLAGWGWLRRGPTPLVNRFSLLFRPSEGLQPIQTGAGGRLAISPDGKRMVYVGPGTGSTRLWVREHDQLHSTAISGTEGGVSPFFSPDGRQVGFLVGGTSLRIVALGGGPPLTLTDKANATAADWGADGYIYVETDSGVSRIRSTGGELEIVFKMSEKETGAEWPVVLPGAKGLLFRLRRQGQGANEFDIMGMKLPKGRPKVLTRGVFARYASSGHLIVVTADGKLIATPFDPDKLALTGPPMAIAEGIPVTAGGFQVDLALSATGTLVYLAGGFTGNRRVVWSERDGREAPADSSWQPQGTINSIALSPNGKALAVGLERDHKEDIWVKQLPSGPFSRITFGDSVHVRPAWSADGQSVLCLAGTGTANSGTPMIARADGTGSPKVLVNTSARFGQLLESRDGKWLILRRVFDQEGSGDIFGVRLGDTTLVPLANTPAREATPAISPDGRWMAYASNESGSNEVYVRPFPEAAKAKWQVSTAGGLEPVWANNGHELFYINGRNQMVAAEIKVSPSFVVGEQKVLFSVVSDVINGFIPSYAVSPDDRRFIFVREGVSVAESELILVQNWFEELKARQKAQGQ